MAASNSTLDRCYLFTEATYLHCITLVVTHCRPILEKSKGAKLINQSFHQRNRLLHPLTPDTKHEFVSLELLL